MPVYRQLRYELQVKKDGLFRVDAQALVDELKLFFDFLNQHPLLKGLLAELQTNMPNFDEWYKRMSEGRRIFWPSNEKERVRLCLAFLRHCLDSGDEHDPPNIALNTGWMGTSLSGGAHFFLEQFFMPFYEYLDQRIEEYSSVLYVLEKFKLRTHWFERKYLLDLYNEDTSRGEAALDKFLRRFLFDNGIEYPFSTPASSSGRADIVASLHTSDPVIVEVKVFDGESRGRSHIRQGFRQVHDYMTDYSKDVGYLVIFNVCNKDLQFNLINQEKPPRVHLNAKTVFIVVVDIYHDITPASERPQLEIYEIKEDELVVLNSS
jgi:hypothetical protein